MENEEKNNSKIKKRYILFVGNLPYKATEDDIKKHFKDVPSIDCVRIITDKKTKKPKGFAFLEVTDSISFQKALMYHQTLFRKRAINVELTAGGGGTSDSRLKKIDLKNSGLDNERKRRLNNNGADDIENVENVEKKKFKKPKLKPTGPNAIPVIR
jgi:nucleolar protein 6